MIPCKGINGLNLLPNMFISSMTCSWRHRKESGDHCHVVGALEGVRLPQERTKKGGLAWTLLGAGTCPGLQDLLMRT